MNPVQLMRVFFFSFRVPWADVNLSPLIETWIIFIVWPYGPDHIERRVDAVKINNKKYTHRILRLLLCSPATRVHVSFAWTYLQDVVRWLEVGWQDWCDLDSSKINFFCVLFLVLKKNSFNEFRRQGDWTLFFPWYSLFFFFCIRT